MFRHTGGRFSAVTLPFARGRRRFEPVPAVGEAVAILIFAPHSEVIRAIILRRTVNICHKFYGVRCALTPQSSSESDQSAAARRRPLPALSPPPTCATTDEPAENASQELGTNA